jgi:hypothetical protein
LLSAPVAQISAMDKSRACPSGRTDTPLDGAYAFTRFRYYGAVKSAFLTWLEAKQPTSTLSECGGGASKLSKSYGALPDTTVGRLQLRRLGLSISSTRRKLAQ